MTTGRTGGGTAVGCGAGTGGGLATGGSPPSNRRNSSSQSLVVAGRDAAGREVVVVERCDSASSVEAVSPGGFFFLSHSTMMEPMPMATRIQNLSMSPRIGMLVALDFARISGKVGVIDSSIAQGAGDLVNCRTASFANRRHSGRRPHPQCCLA